MKIFPLLEDINIFCLVLYLTRNKQCDCILGKFCTFACLSAYFRGPLDGFEYLIIELFKKQLLKLW